MKMLVKGEQSREDVNLLPESEEDFNESHNTSNNGHKYIPPETGFSFGCQDICHRGTAVLKERQCSLVSRQLCQENVNAANGYDVVNTDDVAANYKVVDGLVEQTANDNIEIFISQCCSSGDLMFDIVHADDLENFIKENKSRNILSASCHVCYQDRNEIKTLIHTESKITIPDNLTLERQLSRICMNGLESNPHIHRAEENSAQLLQRNPSFCDKDQHKPGILYVPHMDRVHSRDNRHVGFRETGKAKTSRDRLTTRRNNTDKARHDAGDRWREPGNRGNRIEHRQLSRHDCHTPAGVINPVLDTRYYNTNTYCSDSYTNSDENVPTKYQERRTARGVYKKTNTSSSEGDLPKSRNFSNKRSQPDAVKILKRDEPLLDGFENCTKDVAHVLVDQELIGDSEYDRDLVHLKKVDTQSVAAPGSRVPPMKIDQEIEEGLTELSPEKTKKKRRRSNKRGRRSEKAPKTQLEILQRQVELGHLKSFFSKYKTEGLRNIQLQEQIHMGTYSNKFRASYQNEVVVLSVFCDQDVSDIAAVDMAHMRGSYFVDCFKDCIRGPGPSLWLLTKFCRLGDLHKLLLRDNERHVMGEIHALFISAGVMTGVDYLHRHSIVHGNIKPSKILFNNEGFPVLTGFLKLHDDPDVEKRDVFTPAYAAPERFRGNRAPAVDIFSIGCVAYEIIAGRTPFDGGNVEGTKTRILNPHFRPRYDPELISYAGEVFVDWCLRKHASDRFTLGENRRNVCAQEWFSGLDFADLRRQVLRSPILDAIQLINNRAKLSWEEKIVDYGWGRVMDVLSPDRPTLGH